MWLVPKDNDVRDKLLVVTPVKAGLKKADPGAVQFVSKNNKKIVK
jgi:hypothetical protein